MNPVIVAYLAALAGVGYALWQTFPHHRLPPWPTGPLGRAVANAAPGDYWQPGHEVSEAATGHELTEAIAKIETDPSVPALLSGRELAEREAAEFEALFAEYDNALDDALFVFNEVLEPVRRVLKRWHNDGHRVCVRCREMRIADALKAAGNGVDVL